MKKATLLALAAASVMMFALPAGASASSWDLHWPGGPAEPLSFSVESVGTTSLTTHTGDTVTCASAGGSGEYTTTTTATIKQLTFHGCHDKGTGVTCTTSGQPSGTIVTTEKLTAHNVYSKDPTNNKEYPGVLIKPPAGSEHFASFGCTFFGIGAHVKVTGNGIIGRVEKCGHLGNPGIGSLVFESIASGTQTLTDWTGTTYDLKSSKNGGSHVTASQDGTGNIKFAKTAEATCTIPS